MAFAVTDFSPSTWLLSPMIMPPCTPEAELPSTPLSSASRTCADGPGIDVYAVHRLRCGEAGCFLASSCSPPSAFLGPEWHSSFRVSETPSEHEEQREVGTSSGSAPCASSRAQVWRDQNSEEEVMTDPPRGDARKAKASKGKSKGQGHGYKFCERCNCVHHYKTPHHIAQDRLGKKSAGGARIEAVAIGEERFSAHALEGALPPKSLFVPSARSPRRGVRSAAENRSRRPPRCE